MTQKVLIIDAGVVQGNAQGELNHHYAALAQEVLSGKGYEVAITRVGEPYDVAAEVAKIKDADYLILQAPGFWMSIPWQLKKYMDDVFVSPELCGGDGRHRADPSAKYGSGGFLTQKSYMLSMTWNAPLSAFEDTDGFFEGKGLDGVLISVHKSMAFLGFKKLPSFMANDVLKNPQHEQDFARFKAHLEATFK